MADDRRLLIMTLTSGVFSYLGTLLLDKIPGGVAVFRNSGVYLPGVLFGVLVLAPRAVGDSRGLRRTAAVLLSALIYYAAVKLAMYQAVDLHVREMVACGLSGLLGALALGTASRFILPAVFPLRRWAAAGVIGAAAGAIFGINGTFHVPDAAQAVILILGFTAWQTGVGLAFFRTGNA